ncbi:MAG: DUF86 domain-containing protein [Palaeococcus sp.]|nr:DUF86 domain-containing protein [Palaeococcus sp. (in: euryarchaeotes)]
MTSNTTLTLTGGRSLEYDEDKVMKLMSEAFDALRNLGELSEIPESDFLSNKHYIASAKYNLLVAIESCIDMAYHIISRNRMRIPNDYGDTFRVLNESGLIDEDLTQRLITMAKFRNRLVHIYWDIDDRMIYKIIKEDVKDIEEFIERIRDALKV